MCVGLCACMWATWATGAHEGYKRALDLLEMQQEWLWNPMWVLGNKTLVTWKNNTGSYQLRYFSCHVLCDFSWNLFLHKYF